MNEFKRASPSKDRRFLSNGRLKDVLLVGVLAIVLIFAVWKIFYKEEETSSLYVQTTASETEERVCNLLREIEGVGEASVMICETEDGVQSVVVVCEGANDLQVVMNVREAVAAALGTEQKSVKIYLKKE